MTIIKQRPRPTEKIVTVEDMNQAIHKLEQDLKRLEIETLDKRNDILSKLTALREQLSAVLVKDTECKCENIIRLDRTTYRCTNENCGKIFTIKTK